jgi:hypothetical protein
MDEYFVVDGTKFVPEEDGTPVPDPSVELYELLGDESLAMYNYRGRTAQGGYIGECTPSVMRFEKTPRQPSSDYRVDISPLLNAYLRLNNETSRDDPKSRYLFSPTTAIYNTTGYPKQAYITMQGNRLKMLSVADGYLKFETLKPNSSTNYEVEENGVKKKYPMSKASHPWFVHEFDLVCYDPFQSTLPMKGATFLDVDDMHRLNVSIHAPNEGSDSSRLLE